MTTTLTLSVQVDSQVLEDVHVGGGGDGVHAGRLALADDVLDGLRSHVQHQGVDQLNVVVAPRVCRLHAQIHIVHNHMPVHIQWEDG